MGIVSAMMQVGAAIKHAVAALFKVTHSLRFDGSGDYLTDTFGTPTDQHTWTLSFWLKKADTEDDSVVFDASGNGDIFYIQTRSNAAASNKLQLLARDATIDVGIRTSAAVTFSEWTHVVVAFNRVASSTNDKLKLWVNGSPAGIDTGYDYRSSIGGSTNIPMNRSGETLNIGRYNANSNYMDGQLAEVHFIDGQALTASDFGETRNNQWVPKEVTGVTYGNNGFYLPFDRRTEGVTLLIRGDTLTDLSGNQTPTAHGNAFAGDTSRVKFATGSMSFDGSGDYINAGSTDLLDVAGGDWTIEAWVYLPDLSPNYQMIAASGGSLLSYTNSGGLAWQWFIRPTTIHFFWNTASSNASVSGTHGMSINTWHHVAASRSGSTFRLFIDGAQVASATGTPSAPSGTDRTVIGIGNNLAADPYKGNIEDFRITRGIARDIASGFSGGAPISGGGWDVSLTNDIQYGSLGRDATTNSNDFTVPANTLTPDDQLIDSPNLRFATLSYTNNANVTLSNANLTALSGTSTGRRAVADSGISSGAYYWEVLSQDQTAGLFAGIVNTATPANTNDFIGGNSGAHGWWSYGSTSDKYNGGNNDGTLAPGLPAAVVGDIIRVRFDSGTNTLDVALNNGSWFTISSSVSSGTWYPVFGDGSGGNTSKVTFNFGQDHTFAGVKSPLTSPYTDDDGNGEFYYAPPAGFKALATSY